MLTSSRAHRCEATGLAHRDKQKFTLKQDKNAQVCKLSKTLSWDFRWTVPKPASDFLVPGEVTCPGQGRLEPSSHATLPNPGGGQVAPRPMFCPGSSWDSFLIQGPIDASFCKVKSSKDPRLRNCVDKTRSNQRKATT